MTTKEFIGNLEAHGYTVDIIDAEYIHIIKDGVTLYEIDIDDDGVLELHHISLLLDFINKYLETPKAQRDQEVYDIYNRYGETEAPARDAIKPLHYVVNNGLQTIDLIEGMMTDHQAKGFLIGNIIKYLSRYERKNGVEDLKKAKWYLERLIEKEGD